MQLRPLLRDQRTDRLERAFDDVCPERSAGLARVGIEREAAADIFASIRDEIEEVKLE